MITLQLLLTALVVVIISATCAVYTIATRLGQGYRAAHLAFERA